MVYAHIARDLAVQALHIVARHGSHGSFEDYEAEHDHEEGHDHEVGVDHDHVAELLAAFCRGEGARGDSHTNLRIAAIFIILAGSTLGALFPIVARKVRRLAVRPAIFDFARYFGSGVIIGTAFIHLLAHALEALESPCLSEAWGNYPYALALTLLSIFMIFILEVVAFRWGTAKLRSLGVKHDAHGHGLGASHAAHGPEGEASPPRTETNSEERLDLEKASTLQDNSHRADHLYGAGASTIGDHGLAQLVGIAILEFGVLFHSVLIGLTLAVAEDFVVLFIVIVFHQTFEGLGLGARLAFAPLPKKYAKWAPYAAALVYGVSTPIGIAVGLGVRNSYAPQSATASIVSGVLDSLSAGVLIYTGLVELLAHDFLFNKEMLSASNGKIVFAIGSMLLGCSLMALLGRWA